ncbi:MAG: response regulator [Candidatus Omnitrophica bacterium]|nr:response regulator [Candidatus Omnitrophota bacterium]
MEKEPLTTGDVAKHCHVTHRAVLKWIEKGKLKAYRTPGNHSRVSEEDFIRFLEKYNMPIPRDMINFSNGKKKILVVDDDKAMAHSIRRMLLLENIYEVEVAYDGFSAGREFERQKPDLVLLDIKMPRMDGYEVCKQIREKTANKDVKIIAVSGVVDIEGAEKIIKLGANDYLSKPFDNNFLRRKIERLLEIDSGVV